MQFLHLCPSFCDIQSCIKKVQLRMSKNGAWQPITPCLSLVCSIVFHLFHIFSAVWKMPVSFKHGLMPVNLP